MVDWWAVCDFTPVEGEVVDVPLIAEYPVNLECVVESQIRFEQPDGIELGSLDYRQNRASRMQ